MTNTSMDEVAWVEALRTGDENAFIRLVDQYHTSLVRLARMFVKDDSVGEELAQETWLAVLQGLDRFEFRSSLKTWIFTILTNKARTRFQREKRSFSFSELDDTSSAPTVDPGRFNDPQDERWGNHWTAGLDPVSWAGIPEEMFLSQETMKLVSDAIRQLPENQRIVITLHDIDELSSDEICNVLEISETNQRVLLHRARARVRQALEDYLKLER